MSQVITDIFGIVIAISCGAAYAVAMSILRRKAQPRPMPFLQHWSDLFVTVLLICIFPFALAASHSTSGASTAVLVGLFFVGASAIATTAGLLVFAAADHRDTQREVAHKARQPPHAP